MTQFPSSYLVFQCQQESLNARCPYLFNMILCLSRYPSAQRGLAFFEITAWYQLVNTTTISRFTPSRLFTQRTLIGLFKKLDSGAEREIWVVFTAQLWCSSPLWVWGFPGAWAANSLACILWFKQAMRSVGRSSSMQSAAYNVRFRKILTAAYDRGACEALTAPL